MNTLQAEMYSNLLIAIDRFKKLTPKKKRLAELQIKQVISLKYQIETIAANKGYSKACKSSIPICKGECCKWHFPRHLNHIDFFISIFSMTENQRIDFTKLVSNPKNTHCPILRKTGCFLSFEQRPIPCTNAYPCFADRSYWVEKEMKNNQFKKAMDSLDRIIS